jgi:hypothetical protein
MEQTTSQKIPGKFSPSKKDRFNPKPYEKYFVGKNPDLLGHTIIGIAEGLRLDFPRGLLEPPKHAFEIIARCCGPDNGTTFGETCLWAYKNFNGPKIRNSNDAWFEIARLMQIGRSHELQDVIEETINEEEEEEEKETPQRKEFAASEPTHISTILPKTYVSPEVYWGEKKKITPHPVSAIPIATPTPRKESIIEFITRRSPSINYLRVFILISRHTKNRFSKRGRKVYPYGHEYVSGKLHISIRTVRSIFSWLNRKGIIIKRSNENHELKKCATWFVCTSWKQSFYFRDPERRRPKKGSPRPRRK